jgi:2-hydroxy-3-oxopropionate reductase
MQNIGFIGLGIMGKPMAINLLKAGYNLIIFNRTPIPAEELMEKGCTKVSSVADITKVCDTIITMLPDSPQSEEIIIGENGISQTAKKGTLVIDMSSVNPIVSIKIGEKLRVNGIDFLDAPVSGGEKGAIEGTLAIMVGGKKEVFEKAIPIFKILGSSYILIGETGAGNFAKLVNQIIVTINIAAVSEAFTFAKKAGLSPSLVYNAIKNGYAGSKVLDSKLPMIINRDFRPGFKIDLNKKDLQNVLNAGATLNISLPLTSIVLEILKSLSCSGNGEMDNASIIKFYENISNIIVKE